MRGDSPPRAVALPARQRFVVLGGLGAVVVASWAYLLSSGRGMRAAVTARGAMQAPSAGLLLTMWVVMMAAMMLPTAAPMIVTHARFQRGWEPRRSPGPFSASFTLGYLLAWSGFAALATMVQVGLEGTHQLRPMAMALTSRWSAAAVLAGAAVFQLTPLKRACLRQCRSPIGFFMTAWRKGLGGALVMGLRHGVSCVGCCWALMAVMFVVGAMNMLWAGVLTVWMVIEKVAPRPVLVARLSSIALAAYSVLVLIT